MYKAKINQLIEAAVTRRASDLHLRVPSHPVMRIDGALALQPDFPALKPDDLEELFGQMVSPAQHQQFMDENVLDFSYSLGGVSRCRVSVIKQRGTLSIAIRLIPFQPPTMDELGLPEICRDFVNRPRGILLITGPTGSGKTSTIAAILNYVNQSQKKNIITIEDPIEYVYSNINCIIAQQDLGDDTKSFDSALVHALRHDPDIIVVGEIREVNTMAIALRAAETGHLVMGTLHTSDAAQTVDRIIDMFPAVQQAQVRLQFAQSLVAVMSQTLLPRKKGTGRIAAFEIMVSNPAIRNLIREGVTHQVYGVIQVSSQDGMKTLNQSLSELVLSDMVCEGEALLRSSMVEELKTLINSGRSERARRRDANCRPFPVTVLR